MKEENALIQKNRWSDSKWMQLLKNIRYRLQKRNINKRQQQSLKDVDILAKLLDGKIKRSDIDMQTKKRLIELCDNRTREVRIKIKEIQKQIDEIDNELNGYKE